MTLLEEVARLATEYLNDPRRKSPNEMSARWSTTDLERLEDVRQQLVERLTQLGYRPKP